MREIIKMLVVPTAICAVSGFTLALVHSVTKEPIEYAMLKNVKEPAVKAVLTGFENDPVKDRIVIDVGKDKKGKPVELIVFPAKKGGKTYAVAFESSAGGYHGDIGVMVGMDVDKKALSGISIVSHTETPGLGARIIEPAFTDSFKGKPIDKELGVGDINALSGATLSTKGVVAAVNKAQGLFDKYQSQMVK
ncbi:MAG: RnfABCDGE type electron transport complex subunit G [Desulfarculaceae bacterium]|nr:RnfABCDGE type electron transport complex subunit G [Desulfarculaceae bacterium]